MRMAGVFALLAVLGAAPAAVAGTINVPADYPTIQAAINAAANGDVIIVANGVFKENIDLLGKAITLQGQGEKATTIDGSLGVAPTVTIATGGETATTVISSLGIRKGSGKLIAGKRYGGGIYMSAGADPSIIACAVYFNTAYQGAGLFIDVGCDPILQDKRIHNNTTATSGTGGGLYSVGNPILDGNRITENIATAGTGGGAYLAGSTTTITNNEFDNNLSYYGGGLHINGGSPVITDNIFEQNNVSISPINGEGAGLAVVGGGTPWVSNNEFRTNIAHTGAGVYVYDAAPSIVTNLIHDNSALTTKKGGMGYGGGLSLGKGRGTIELNEIYYNVAALGGGISARSSTTTMIVGNVIDHNDTGGLGVGGGVFTKDSTSAILGNTIAFNGASNGGGLYAIGVTAPTLDTTIIYFNLAPTNPSYFDGTGVLVINFCDIEAAAIGGTSLDVDPHFADAANRDFRLLATSPVIDAGNFTFGGGPTDVYGNARVNGGRVDMGASEN